MLNFKKIHLYFTIMLLLTAANVSATEHLPLTDEFVAYHLRAAAMEVEDDSVFFLIQENVNNLDIANTSESAAHELIHLIDEGYKIDALNMAKLIALLKHASPSDNATQVILKAIENDSPLNAEHLSSLIQTLTHANASNNAAEILLKAIECGVKFGPKERLLLAEASKTANALQNVEKIRKALHEQTLKN